MLQNLTKQVTQFVTQNASGILTGVGVAGTVGTAVLTGRATFKAAELIQEREAEPWVKLVEGVGEVEVDFTRTDKIKLVWSLYIPPTGVAVATIASIIFANRISAGRAAALAAAYSLSQDQFKEYRDKATEKLGVNKQDKMVDEIAQERVTSNPPGEVYVIGNGEILCMDMYSGRYFRSSVDKIKKAENATNHCITQNDYADLTSFYLDIGLPKTGYSDEMGWNSANPLDVRLTTALSPNDEPCIAINFVSHPRTDFHQSF